MVDSRDGLLASVLLLLPFVACGPAIDCEDGACAESDVSNSTRGASTGDASTGGTADPSACIDHAAVAAGLAERNSCEQHEDCGALLMPCYTGPEKVCGRIAINQLLDLPPAVDAATQCDGSCDAPTCTAVAECVAGRCTLVEVGTCEEALAQADAFISTHSACETRDDCRPVARQCYPPIEETCGSIALNEGVDSNEWFRLSWALTCRDDCTFDIEGGPCEWDCIDGGCRMLPL